MPYIKLCDAHDSFLSKLKLSKRFSLSWEWNDKSGRPIKMNQQTIMKLAASSSCIVFALSVR